MDECTIVERELAAELGISHNQLKGLRAQHLQETADWRLVQGFVCYTPKARAKVMAALGLKITQPKKRPPAPEGNVRALLPAKSATSLAVQLATIVGLTKNRHIVMADLGPERIRIRVKASRNFRKGMEAPVRLLEDNLYELACRCPRRSGRW